MPASAEREEPNPYPSPQSTELERKDINLSFSATESYRVSMRGCEKAHPRLKPNGKLGSDIREGAMNRGKEGSGGICIIIKSADPNLHIPIAFLADQGDALSSLGREEGFALLPNLS